MVAGIHHPLNLTNPKGMKGANNRLIAITIAFYLVGMSVFYAHANFSRNEGEIWNEVYYLWDNVKDLLFLLCLK